MGTTTSLDKKMKEASIFALTSKTECFPMVLLESLACGLPIVSYNCPYGPRNIIMQGEDGLLVQQNNIANFTASLSELIENNELRSQMSKYGVENVQLFSQDKVMELWQQLFVKKD